MFFLLQWVFILCVPTILLTSLQVFFLWERIVFLWSLGLLRCITFSLQIRGIYNQNFLWDHKISKEPGSLVPRDSPALPFSTKPKLIIFFWFGSVSKQQFTANLRLLHFQFYKIHTIFLSIHFMVFNLDWINASFASVRFANCWFTFILLLWVILPWATV